jgi:exodeoxyribonuclease VII large subunit
MSESYTQNVTPRGNNAPELTVSDLAQSLKRTLEDAYGRVRVRGELSRVNVVSSGHMYSDLKDENCVINVICWRGSLAKLAIKPEEGLDVICTGRITTYPQRSNYQLIIESMELAGEGALLKMLEERKKRLAAEGLFAEERKKALPFLPDRIGVVTSPTGAVIRDIIHRISERFPREIMLWPVRVQGDGAAAEITAAIRGFNALPAAQRPDLIIVARGGGSLEDLMAFNEENVVRAVAESDIPVISAVGHETDTTLVDYASDKRAPTPTGAAEIAVPERLMLLARVQEDQSRLIAAITRQTEHHKKFVASLAARIADPRRLIEVKAQRIDHQYERLRNIFRSGLNKRQNHLLRLEGRIKHPQDRLAECASRVKFASQNLGGIRSRLLTLPIQRLSQASRMLETLSYQSILQRGYSVIRNDLGAPITAAAQLSPNQNITIQLHDDTCDAIISGSENAPKKHNKVPAKKNKSENANEEQSIKKVEREDELGSNGSKPQGSLF